jgi:hypothetical protein
VTTGAREEPPQPEPDTVALIFAEIAGALERQASQLAALNTRAQQLLTFAGLILGAVITLRPPSSRWPVSLLFAASLVLFVAIAYVGYRAWSLVGLRRDPAPGPLWHRYRLWPEDWLRQQLILNWIEAEAQNERSIDAKLWYLRLTQVLLGLEVVYLAIIVIIRPYIS